MTDYQAQAKQFLTDCNATMEINLVGKIVETVLRNPYALTQI